ncbi:MAG: helix-turn-helix transcriptional regulator [Zetaproteobacteria bacterium]|nr:helix-turn-helix transcriptional regulator [Zetaproteobacteria bacterium]
MTQDSTVNNLRESTGIEIEIGYKMICAGLPREFVTSAVKVAFEFEGVCDLLKLWDKEEDVEERKEILADIQDMVDDCASQKQEEATYIRFDDLAQIAQDVTKFKDNLRLIVEQKGGIGALAQKTGIPQPSLSRFFNSASMPRRVTLLKISKALGLTAVDIATEWAR